MELSGPGDGKVDVGFAEKGLKRLDPAAIAAFICILTSAFSCAFTPPWLSVRIMYGFWRAEELGGICRGKC